MSMQYEVVPTDFFKIQIYGTPAGKAAESLYCGHPWGNLKKGVLLIKVDILTSGITLHSFVIKGCDLVHFWGVPIIKGVI